MTRSDSFAPTEYPLPIRPAVRAGEWVVVSGQFGQVNYRLVEGGIVEQTRQALRNIQRLLEAENATMSNVVKTTVYLADIADFDAMNRVYLEFFDLDRLPTRTTAGANLPFGALVEIEGWSFLHSEH